MSAVDRAAEVLNQEVVRQSVNDAISITVHSNSLAFEAGLARALDEVGLLATEEHDRQVQADYWSGKYPRAIAAHDRAVAARALREAADEMVTTINEHAGGGNLVRQRRVIDVARLRERADRIEERR